MPIQKKHESGLYEAKVWEILWRNFLAGSCYGVGFVIGTALFITIVTFLLNQILGKIPFFSDLARAIDLWISSINVQT